MGQRCGMQCTSCPTSLGSDEEEVIRKIIEDFGSRILRFLFRENQESLSRGYLDVQDIKDVWQLTFTHIWKSFPTQFECRGEGSLRAWIYAIAYHESIQYSMKQTRRFKVTQTLAEGVSLLSPNRYVEQEVDNRLIVKFLTEEFKKHGGIPPGEFKTCWRMFIARFVEGIPASEIAETEGYSKEEVEKITKYIRETMRKLGGNLYEDS